MSNNENGGAALEYLVVTIFGIIVSLMVISICGKVVHEKLQEAFSKLGIEPFSMDFNFLL